MDAVLPGSFASTVTLNTICVSLWLMMAGWPSSIMPVTESPGVFVPKYSPPRVTVVVAPPSHTFGLTERITGVLSPTLAVVPPSTGTHAQGLQTPVQHMYCSQQLPVATILVVPLEFFAVSSPVGALTVAIFVALELQVTNVVQSE